MDATAIKQIQDTSTVEAINKAISWAVGPTAVAVPKEFNLVTLEKYQAYRDRFRGRLFTKSITEFASYAKTFATEGATTFIDAEKMAATHIIDLGDQDNAGHCEHKALVALDKTAPYKALLAIVDQRKSQREIAEFIEDWRTDIKAFYEADINGVIEEMSIPKALQAIRKIKIEAVSSNETTQSNFGAASTSMDSIDVRSQDIPPAFLEFSCEPYAGLERRTFLLRLGMITERPPALVFRIVRAEEHQELMAIEFQQKIQTAVANIEPKIQTFIGTFSE